MIPRLAKFLKPARTAGGLGKSELVFELDFPSLGDFLSLYAWLA